MTMLPTTWQAQFVGGDRPSEPGDPALYLRREFEVGDGLVRATLRATALGLVEPRLNGAKVGDEELAPGWTSYKHRLHVSSYDVTALLHAGTNALGAIVGEGWAVGPLTWHQVRHQYADRPAVLLQLELDYPDCTEIVGTDATWRLGSGAVRENGLYAGEAYDARLENDWDSPGFDDSIWATSTPYDWDLTTLVDTGAPPIRRTEELPAVTITRSQAGHHIVDFGQNLSGWVRLTVTGEAGTTLTVRHAEILKPDGELERETNRTAEATDRYTLRGGGPETWEPRFTFHGFRYAEIEGWPGELSPADVTAVVVHTDLTRTGWFETSNPLLNQLHSNTTWSMRDNWVGVPTDCPQRDERLGWTGDLNAFTPTAMFLYDVKDHLASWLRDLAAEQAASGNVPWVVPDVLSHPSPPTALWSDIAVSLPWNLYQEYGDVELLRTAYPSMRAFITQVEALLDEHGLWSLGFQFGDWLDPDAPPDNAAGGKTDAHLVGSAYLCRTTRELAETAALLGETDDAVRFSALADRVRSAFRREYVTEVGRVVNETATAYALAIQFGVLDEDQRRTAGGRLAEIVTKAGYTISTGFAGTPLVTDALSTTGHLGVAYRLLLQEKCPSFLYPVTQGATTIWERWDAVLPDGSVNATGMTSLNHYALGAVADWMHRVIGGLQRVEPGWRRIRVAPQPGGDLTSARTTHDTPLGRAVVAWQLQAGGMSIDVTIPDGATAEVVLPFHPESLTAEVGAGTHSWRYGIPAEELAAPTMDTPIADLAKHPAIWDTLLALLAQHFPGIPIDIEGNPLAASMSLNQMIPMMPINTTAFEADVRKLFD